ncbi:acyltransferase [Winogradskyella sp. PAMC22761]|nr:acyltransferase [Winogradskyella sp. PAMC22761]
MQLSQLTFTRFLAAISIVIYHYGLDVFPFNLEVIKHLFSQSYLGVSYFFVLSGFVLVIAYGNKEEIQFRNFIKRRIARIYPLYIFAIFLSVFFSLVRIDLNLIDFVLNIFMIQNWFPDKAMVINYPGWSICAEFFFYISFPLLFNNFYNKVSLNKIIFSVVLFQLIIILVVNIYSSLYFKYLPIVHIGQFMMGNITGLIFLKKRNIDSRTWKLLLIILFTIIVIVFPFENLKYDLGIMSIFFAVFIYLFSENRGPIARFFKTNFLIYLGEISYGIYILQYPVWLWSRIMFKQIYKITGIAEIPYQYIFWINIFLLIVFSAFCYKYIEMPLRNKINKINISSKVILSNK